VTMRFASSAQEPQYAGRDGKNRAPRKKQRNRTSLERGEPKETHGNANGSPVRECEEHQRGGMIPQCWHKPLPHVQAEGFSVTDWIGRVGVLSTSIIPAHCTGSAKSASWMSSSIE
jgi:hypothetical protein